MKKRFRCGVSLAFTAVLLVSALCACGTQNEGDGVLMNYTTGTESTHVLDREMFFSNNNDVVAADPGVVYVSEEESEEWGGYYYLYATGSSVSYSADGNLYCFHCFRSKNCSEWNLVGEYYGYSLKVTSSDWLNMNEETQWAPQVIYNAEDGKFYMYFSASAKSQATVSSPSYQYDRLYIGIAVGDSPVAFRILGAEETVIDADGKLVTNQRPPVDFERAYGLDHVFSVIDVDPFLDDDGTLYLYFNKHTDSAPNTPNLMGVWGIAMKDWITPDYSTLTAICMPDVLSCEGGLVDGEPQVTSLGETYNFSEGSINEAPFMIKYEGKYYMTYSAVGYTSPSYSVHQAISDSPLGTFVKPQISDGNPVLYSSTSYVSGTGHHSIVKAGDDYMIVYARMGNPDKYSYGWVRFVGTDLLYFVSNGAGDTVLTSNGPSYSPQPLPQAISGYENVAPRATVTASSGSGTEYLNDKIVSYYNFSSDWYYAGSSGSVITLSWDEAVPVSAIMVYNCNDYDYCYSDIASVKLVFAEQPSWASRAYAYGLMQNILFPEEYVYDTSVIKGAAAIMQFETVKVTSIEITLGGKYEEYDAMGNPSDEIRIPEIVVLGKEA